MYNIIRVLTKRVCMNDNYYRNIIGVPYKMLCFIEMQFAAYFYTVVPHQALIRLPIYKNSAISKSGAIFLSFCKIRDFGSPTIMQELPTLQIALSLVNFQLIKHLNNWLFYAISFLLQLHFWAVPTYTHNPALKNGLRRLGRVVHGREALGPR